MSQTAVLVWLSAASLLPTFHADLSGYAQSRLLRLEAPRENAATFRAAAYAPDVAAQIEVLLEEARNATASLEQSRALSALEHAERLLREHPELPQAAWLMAEVLGLTADVESSAPDGTNAAVSLRKRAAALEGPRAAPFSDHPADPELEPLALHTVSAEGLEPDDELEWDGEQKPAHAAISSPSGEHHVRISRNGRLLWAGWLALSDTDLRVRLPVPETPACSLDDIGAGHFEGVRAVPAAHARCESYVLARSHSGTAADGIDVATCERAVCGAVVTYRYVSPRAGAGPTAERGWPRWATYTAIAAAGVLTTGIVLWRAGAFDRPEGHTTTNVIYMGQAKPAGFQPEKPFGFQF